jgi:hypothetical protein
MPEATLAELGIKALPQDNSSSAGNLADRRGILHVPAPERLHLP